MSGNTQYFQTSAAAFGRTYVCRKYAAVKPELLTHSLTLNKWSKKNLTGVYQLNELNNCYHMFLGMFCENLTTISVFRTKLQLFQ